MKKHQASSAEELLYYALREIKSWPAGSQLTHEDAQLLIFVSESFESLKREHADIKAYVRGQAENALKMLGEKCR